MLAPWAAITPTNADIRNMFERAKCPGNNTPDFLTGEWCQTSDQQCYRTFDCGDYVVSVDGGEFRNLINTCLKGGSGCPSVPIEYWDTSRVTDMSKAFFYQETFNEPLTCWSTGGVTNMSRMFNGAYVFNQDVSFFDTSRVQDMDGLFSYANAFNQNIGAWDTSSATNMANMFWDAFDFNPDIGNWNTSNVSSMRGMFMANMLFNADLGLWGTSRVTNMESMFSRTNTFDHDISMWDTSKVSTMKRMFSHATKFNQEISMWDTSRVTDMYGMFYRAQSFDQCLAPWAAITPTNANIRNMFQQAKCPGNNTPDFVTGEWCQTSDQQCTNDNPSSPPSSAPSKSCLPSPPTDVGIFNFVGNSDSSILGKEKTKSCQWLGRRAARRKEKICCWPMATLNLAGTELCRETDENGDVLLVKDRCGDECDQYCQ